MKKLFSKIETKIDNTAKETNNYVGKVFTVGRLTVTVEDILAEGELHSTMNLQAFNTGLYRWFCYSLFSKGSEWNAICTQTNVRQQRTRPKCCQARNSDCCKSEMPFLYVLR